MTGFAVASFLAFGALLVLFGSNSSALIADLGLDFGGAIEPDGDPSQHESGEATEIPEIKSPLDDESA